MNGSYIDQIKPIHTGEDGIYLVQLIKDKEEFYKEISNHYKWIMSAVDILHIYDDNGIHNFNKVANETGEGIKVCWHDDKKILYLLNATMN